MRQNSVGLLLLGQDTQGAIAYLHIREPISPRSGKQHLYPGAAQVTVHGSLEAGETATVALRREIHEELDEMYQQANVPVPPRLRHRILHFLRVKFFRLFRKKTKSSVVTTVGYRFIDSTVQELLQPLLDCGALRAIHAEDIDSIIPIDPNNVAHKHTGFAKGELAMFADEIQALRKAFKQGVRSHSPNN